MNYSIPQEKFKHVIFKYMDDKFNSFERRVSVYYPNSFFYVEGNRIMCEVIPTQKALVVDWSLWEDIFNTFSFKKTPEFQNVMNEWVKKKFDWDSAIFDFHDFDDENMLYI